MLIFDRVSMFYDYHYNKIKSFILEFDSNFISWKTKALKLEEWKETRRRQKEIQRWFKGYQIWSLDSLGRITKIRNGVSKQKFSPRIPSK